MLTMKKLSEDDTSAKLITPALHQAGWAESAIRRQVAFTTGRIIVRGKLVTRGRAKRADYVLYIGHFPIASALNSAGYLTLFMTDSPVQFRPQQVSIEAG